MTSQEIIAMDQKVINNKTERIASNEKDRKYKKEQREKDREAAGNYVFGISQAAFEAVGNIAEAAVRVRKNREAQRLVQLHNIDIRSFIQKQINDTKYQYKTLQWHLALGVVALAFTKPNEVSEEGALAEVLAGEIFGWFDALREGDLPEGFYINFLDEQELYEKNLGHKKLDTYDDYKSGFSSKEKDDECHKLYERSDQSVKEKFEAFKKNSSAAIAWFMAPEFVKWKSIVSEVKGLAQSEYIKVSDIHEGFNSMIKKKREFLKRMMAFLGELPDNYWTLLEKYEEGSEKFKKGMGKLAEFKSNSQKQNTLEACQKTINEINRIGEFAKEFKIQFVIPRQERQEVFSKRAEQARNRRIPRGNFNFL